MIRIGVVGFTNTLPLAQDLERYVERAMVLRATPAEIADYLEAGRLDLGLVPVATWARNSSWPIVPGLGIASEGPVRSVLLVSRVPIAEIENLVLDPASRTSNILARLWLKHVHGVTPVVHPGSPDPRARLAEGSATVIIGDDALEWSGTPQETVDLGQAWTEWTGLPFVFAVWAGPAARDPGLIRGLESCYAANRKRIPELAAGVVPAGLGLGVETIVSYLTETIRYPLGERENRGLERFLELGTEAGHFPGTGRGVAHVHAG